LFTDDAVIDAQSGFCASAPCVGKAAIQKAGFERIILWEIREFRGEKIASTRCCMPEHTDSQTLHFLEWDYAHPSLK
jgi:hypothetical protein